jgi:hypothetical protein
MLAVGLPAIYLFATFQLAINLLVLVVSSRILHDLGEVGISIHAHIFSPTIHWTRSMGDNGVFARHGWPLWMPLRVEELHWVDAKQMRCKPNPIFLLK